MLCWCGRRRDGGQDQHHHHQQQQLRAVNWWRHCDVTTMWTTKAVDSHLSMTSRLRDVICGQLTSCMGSCCKLAMMVRCSDALVPAAAAVASSRRSSSCAAGCASRRGGGGGWRCKWLNVVCTKGFLIIVNLLFLVSALLAYCVRPEQCSVVRVTNGQHV